MLSAQPESPTRWAVLAPPGLGDLLTAELSKQPGIELVERTDIDKVMNEQELAALFGTGAVKKRMELGAIQKAGRLLVIRKENETRLDLSVIDTMQGLLLFHELLNLENKAPDQTATIIGEIVGKINTDFRDGVKAILCVPHFLSKNISKEFEPFQEIYANTIAFSLLQTPGVAVVLLEEFDAIRKELSFSGQDRLRPRAVQMLIQGEFSVQYADALEPSQKTDFSISMTDAGQTLAQIDKKGVSPEDIPKLLSQEVPAKIRSLLGEKNTPPFSMPQQERYFCEKARQFRLWGSPAAAAKHREAALLINPDNTMQRLALIDDLLGIEELDVHYAGMTNRYFFPKMNSVYSHAEILFKNRKISLPQGLLLLDKIGGRGSMALGSVNVGPPSRMALPFVLLRKGFIGVALILTRPFGIGLDFLPSLA